MRPRLPNLLLAAAVLAGAAAPATAAEPDYAEWNRLLAGYSDPARGVDYGGLRARERPALERLRQALAGVDVGKLGRDEQLAFWLNLYNVNVVSRVVDGYPLDSIRDLSTDPLVRLNVFKKETVPFAGGKVSLDWIEHEKVRAGFRDPRIHFALNCAARSCPPLRREAYVGARVQRQLDEQTRAFLAGPGARVEGSGARRVLRLSKIFDWFEEDFTRGGGVVPFVRRHLPSEKALQLPPGVEVDVEHADYDWALNDWRR